MNDSTPAKIERARRWFRDDPGDLDDLIEGRVSPGIAEHAATLVRAALAAETEPQSLGYRKGFDDGVQYARDIDRTISRMTSEPGPDTELVEAARDGMGNGSWPPTARKVAEAFVALAAETTETEYRVTGTDRAGIGAVSDWMPTWHEARGYCVTWERYGITDLAIESRQVATACTETPWTEQKQ